MGAQLANCQKEKNTEKLAAEKYKKGNQKIARK